MVIRWNTMQPGTKVLLHKTWRNCTHVMLSKKNPERKLYILTNSIYTKFIKKAKLTHDIRIGGRVVNFGKQERGSG